MLLLLLLTLPVESNILHCEKKNVEVAMPLWNGNALAMAG